MLKSMRSVPVPQPPAAASAWMMPSDVPLFGSVEMSVFHGLSASKSRPATVVVDTALVLVDVVLGRDVEVLDDDVVGRDVEVLDVVLDVLGGGAAVELLDVDEV